MKTILYFLRSSEQKIVMDMLYYSSRVNETNKSISDFECLEAFYKFYGLSSKDIGLYALYENKLAGAVWIRKLKHSDKVNAFIDKDTPILNIAIKPEFRSKKIASQMMDQLLLEAASMYEQISVSAYGDTVDFFEKFGFEKVLNLTQKSPIDNKEVFTMIRRLILKDIERPKDNYDPQRWMD
jgi:ribosomal protein S18 acetylase RimI-like enzyme